MVNINLKSSRELIVELEELLESYESANVSFEVIKKAHQDRDRAQAWLRRNKDENHPQYSLYKSLEESTKELATKYVRIATLEKRVRKRQKEEEDDAAPKIFWLIYFLFKKGTGNTALVASEYYEFYDNIYNELNTTLAENDKIGFDVGLNKLQRLGIIEDVNCAVWDDSNVQYGIFHAILLLEDDIQRNNNISFGELWALYQSKLEYGLRNLFEKGKRCDALYSYYGGEYAAGPNWEDFMNGPFTFSDWFYLTIIEEVMDHAIDNDDMPILSEAVRGCLEFESRERFYQFFQCLNELHIIRINDNIVNHGNNTLHDVENWLKLGANEPLSNSSLTATQLQQRDNQDRQQQMQQRQQRQQTNEIRGQQQQQQGQSRTVQQQQRQQHRQIQSNEMRRRQRLVNDCNGNQCNSCRRRQMISAAEYDGDPYRMTFHSVQSTAIRKQGAFKPKHIRAYSGSNACEYILCDECYGYLVEKEDKFKNIWPLFYWNLLSGCHHSMTRGLVFHYNVYGGEQLWRFIPLSMRAWWIDEVKSMLGRDRPDEAARQPYEECSLTNPPPIFHDKTMEMMRFNNDYNSGELARVVNAMNNEDVINNNVLCPWSCSASCRESGRVPVDIMIQRMLPKIVLTLYHASAYCRVQWSCNYYLCNEVEYPKILLNDKWIVKPSIQLGADGVQVITCKYHDGGQDKLTLFPPRSPYGHILNAKQSDQLAHCVPIQRVTKQTQANKYCTKFGVTRLYSHYSGVNTMDVRSHSDFSGTSELLSQHESASIVGREDICILLSKKVQNGEISQALADTYVRNAQNRYSQQQLQPYIQGATYVSFENMIHIHLFESSADQNIQIVNDRPNRGTRQAAVVSARRSWPIAINLLQTEDSSGYGTQFRSIPKFNLQHVPSALTWSLFAILSSSPSLWRVVDTKQTLFRWSGWEGWILTAIQSFCFQFHSIQVDSRSPFKKLTSMKSVAAKVNAFISSESDEEEEEEEGASFYKCSIKSYYNLFPPSDYNQSLSVLESIEEAVANDHSHAHKKVIIVVGDDAPTKGNVQIGSANFDLQVICVLKADKKGRNVNGYDAVRYMRHPKHHSYWKQERKDSIATQCVAGENIYNELQFSECYFLQYVAVYVKVEDICVDHWRGKFFKSMGGKPHVQCGCNNSPLIPTNISNNAYKLKCNAKRFVREDGSQYENQYSDCKKMESYVCTNVHCTVKMCSRCYKTLSTDTVTTVVPCNNQLDGDREEDESFMENTQQREEEEEEKSNDERENSNNNLDDDDDDESAASSTQHFFLSTMQDTTLDQTWDNQNNNQGFATTNACDIPNNVEQLSTNADRVSGHVIFNQVGSCTTRHNKTITGTSRQKHFVQNLCATSPGQASPLLQPEASLFPRHYYASSTIDSCSILGAQPLFLLSGKTSPYGFASTLSQARIHMTNPFSTTSTDPTLMCYYFDEIGNKVLSSVHSRDVFERGFVVDSKSAYGMTVRDKGHSNLSQSVDSCKMVLNLAGSQKYIKYTWFLTITANQSKHPGLAHLHEWKNSMKWAEIIPNYESLSSSERLEIKQAVEEAYGAQVFSAWGAVKYMFLRYLKTQCTRLKTNTAIFARDEYQKDTGNLCHNHLIFAVDTSTMNGDTEKFIQDLIRTSVMDIVKSEDVERMLANGLLKSVDEVAEVHDLANVILRHNCDDRCKIRVGPGESENDFRCRKLHAVRDSTDCTTQSYITIPHEYKESTLEVLEDMGLFVPASDEDTMDGTGKTKGTFNHPYFVPKRHLAPCVNSATCNMSPVIADFFVAFKSMQNAQALDHTNGIAKYVCKYIAKFDEGNYVVLCQDIHTGQWVLGKTHLHNTKVVRSKINEDKAFDKERYKNHPKGRDMPHFEIRQIMMGDPEVFTDLDFIQVSTLPFELRPTNSIVLDSKGNIVNNNRADDDDDYPDDAFESTIPMQRSRLQINLCEHHRMTDTQMLTYKNHDGKAAKYDMISLFSLRPPELLGVFRNPVDYYRYCYIDDKTLNEKKVEDMLVPDLYQCPWIDCLGRRVKIRELALNDVSELVERNLRVLDESNAELSDAQTFAREVNMVVRKIVAVHQSSVEDLDAEDSLWLEEQVPNFIHCDNSDNLPIPILSNTSPLNALQFLTHIILSLGEYNTEIDALTHATSRDCLRAAGLIGNATDQESLQRYSNELGRKYVEEQVVFYPNSLTKSETFIVTAQKVLDDAIVHNALSINELPPFTMSSLRVEKTAENEQLWTDHKTSQLQSVYNTLNNTQGIPSKEDVLAAERDSPLQWDPLETVVRYEHQSEESFEEQQLAIELNVRQIKKYRNISGIESVTYTKNPVVYGAPGTGKSFVGQLIVLYAISQGLNIISTALMGARANALGGIHIHKLFPLPVDRGSSMSPFKLAQEALGKITRKPDLMFLIRTMDAIFLDEAATVSAEILSALDIILRVERKSQIPFGGILILGTMDPTQIQPINQLPFLTSSLMLTCFVMVELKCSVRAHGDTDFQRLQAIIRMNPFVLMTPNTPMTSEQIAIKEEFFELAGRVLTFVPNWSDPRISPNMMRVFSRVRPAQEALDDYRESIKQQLINDGTDHHLAISRDVQKAQQTNTDSYRQASEQSVKTLNKELKEPSELVLFAGGVYECTINDPSGRFCYSQLAFMLDLPSRDDVINFNSIAMWIAPGGLQHIEYDQNNMPTRQQLLDAEWKEVRIGCASERLVSVRGGLQAKRLQYALKHIGAVTINKSQGATLPAGLAVEITEEYSPWESGQIVVLSSRTTIGSRTLVVGNKNFAINKMWELITQGNQWTRYTEHVLDLISINGNSRSGSNTTQNDRRVLFDYPSVYPFRMCDAIIPTDTTGYVYCLVSKRNPGKIYIGETTCLSQRVINHNSGNGAQDTEDVRDWPWTPAAYICGLGHMTTSDRRSLERSWKQHIADLCRRGQRDSYTWIRSGARVVDIHNSGADDEKIRFILCITAETANANNT